MQKWSLRAEFLVTALTTKNEIILWQSELSKIKITFIKQLVIFLIVKQLSSNQLNQDLKTEFDQIFDNVRNLIEKK